MKILIRNSDNLVLLADSQLTIGPFGATGSDWTSRLFTTEEHSVAEVELPDIFEAHMYAYVNGEFVLKDAGRYEALQAELAETSKQEHNSKILALIEAKEKEDICNRGAREMAIYQIRKEGISKGYTEEQIIAGNHYYRRLIARDAEITALRFTLIP